MEDLKELRSLLIKEQYYLDKIQNYNLLDNNSNKLRRELMNLNLKDLEVIENNIDKYKDKDSCDHLWVDDLIDLTPDASRYVTYCGNCFITKK